MSDKGIIFSAPMVRALLDGRKTQTRRLIKLPKEYSRPDMGGWEATTTGGEGVFAIVRGQRVNVPERAAIWNQTTGTTIGMPYAVGDRLYVREAHRHWSLGHDCEVTYLADGARMETGPNTGQIPHESLQAYFKRCDRSVKAGKAVGYPCIHMPRWASRLWLTVAEARVQPLQKITLGDICAEGLASSIYDFKPIQRGFAAWMELWNSLHTTEGERWQDDPWIVAITFDVHHGNIDQEAASEHA